MKLIEVVVVCMIILLFSAIIVHPVIMIENMQNEIIQTRKEIYALREELNQLQEPKENTANDL